ncbi:MAG: hypothetical protein WC164_04005, partial [Patescibacteria group bacterium]
IKKRQGRRKIVALGDMLELGNYSEEGHQLIGGKISKLDVDEIILVGERSRDIGRGAIAGGFDKNFIFQFKESGEAGLFLQKRMSEGDVILLKGSQGIRMEKAVKEVMAEPMKSTEILVRQSEEWIKK